MDYLRGWRALRQDPQLLMKLLIGTVLTFVPLVGPIVLTGWRALILRRAVSGQELPLPRLELDFEYLKELLMAGFKGFLAQLLWSLPLVVVFMGAYLGCVISAFAIAGLSGGGESAGLAMLCVAAAFCVIVPVLIIAASMPLHVATLRAELTDDVGVAMRFKDVFTMTRVMAKELIVGQLVFMLLGLFVVLPIGVFTLGLGLYPATIVLQVSSAYWLAQIYERYVQKGGEALPIGPLDVAGGNLPAAAPPQF